MSRYFENKFGINKRGFTLIEMLVSLGIAMLILTVLVLNQSKYTEMASLTAASDDLSLAVTQAQVYGISVREISPGAQDFSAAYGVGVNLLGSGANNIYIFFADRNANQRYDGSWTCPVEGGTECLERTPFSGGNYVDSLCVVRTNGADQCGSIGRVDISFLRPDPEARIRFQNQGGESYDPPSVKGVRINLKSPSGLTRSVVIYITGQVSVQ
jgi:type II secretory pathway pseudopilin PulG